MHRVDLILDAVRAAKLNSALLACSTGELMCVHERVREHLCARVHLCERLRACLLVSGARQD